MRTDRLSLLADFLETKVPEGRWHYAHIVGRGWQGKEDLSCGATACALGWAATIPELREAGMRLPMVTEGTFEGQVDTTKVFEFAETVFEISAEEAEYLFNGGFSDHIKHMENVTAKEVASAIRDFMENDGIPDESAYYEGG